MLGNNQVSTNAIGPSVGPDQRDSSYASCVSTDRPAHRAPPAAPRRCPRRRRCRRARRGAGDAARAAGEAVRAAESVGGGEAQRRELRRLHWSLLADKARALFYIDDISASASKTQHPRRSTKNAATRRGGCARIQIASPLRQRRRGVDPHEIPIAPRGREAQHLLPRPTRAAHPLITASPAPLFQEESI